MGKNSGIEWTDHTFNPWWGCTRVSPGCDFCYAETFAARVFPGTPLWGTTAARRTFGDKHWAEPLHWNRHAAANGKNPRVFCASMADLFDKDAPDGQRDRLWGLVRATPALRWLILTKRIGNAPAMLPPFWRELDNAGLGITVVNQPEAERDIHKLAVLPARMRFLSIEPMLGPVDLAPYLKPAIATGRPLIDWVIVGGESGGHARPMHPSWVRRIRDQCQAAGVAFFFKQWGEWKPELGSGRHGSCPDFSRHHNFGDGRVAFRVGKKAAGRLLDGSTYSEFPRWRTNEQKETIDF